MLLSEFLITYDSYRDVRPSTLDQYRWCIEHLAKHLGRPPRMGDLTSDIINRWLRSAAETLSPYTVQSRRMTVLSIWNLAAELKLVEPPRLIRRVKVPRRRIRVRTADEIRQLLDAANALDGEYNRYRWADLMRTWIIGVLESALRPGDMQSLEWPDVVQCQGRLTIVQRKTRQLRRVLFSAELLADIASWHSPAGLVWPAGHRHTYGRRLAELAAAIGLVGLTHTALRKTAITDVESQVPGAGWIFAGHASPSTTREWYICGEAAYRDIPGPRLV